MKSNRTVGYYVITFVNSLIGRIGGALRWFNNRPKSTLSIIGVSLLVLPSVPFEARLYRWDWGFEFDSERVPIILLMHWIYDTFGDSYHKESSVLAWTLLISFVVGLIYFLYRVITKENRELHADNGAELD